MSFAQIQDQDVAIRLLRGVCRSKRIPSGLLFWGPEGVGKRMAALEFAKAANCTGKDDDACDACLSCRKTDHHNHPDVVFIAPSGKGRIINVKMIEAMNEMTVFRPYEGGTRMVIIEEADRMHEAAQNKFLKTLEEPPSKTVFLLISAAPRLLLPTIVSRCQRIRFRTLHEDTIAALLSREGKCSPEQARMLAPLSQGSMARALDLLNTDRREVVLDIVGRLASREDPLQVSELFAAHLQEKEKQIADAVKAESSARNNQNPEEGGEMDKEVLEALVAGQVRREAREYLRLFDAWYRDEMIHAFVHKEELVFNRDHVARLAKAVNPDRQAVKLAAINDAAVYIERNMQSQRVFRDLFFELAR